MTQYSVLDGDTPLATLMMGVEPADARAISPSGDEIVSWVEDGCPSLEGREDKEGITERPITVLPKDPLWGLAFLEAIEDRGWRLVMHTERALEYVEEQHPRDEHGRWTDKDGGEGRYDPYVMTDVHGNVVPPPVEKKKKAPKAPPVPIESKKAAYDEVKKGGTFKATSQKYGMTQGQLAGYVWKVDQAKKKAEESLEEAQMIKDVVKATPVVAGPTKSWLDMTPDEKMQTATDAGYKWQLKPNSTHGNYAWYNKSGEQVSGFGPKETYKDQLANLNYGKGVVPETPLVSATETGPWPINDQIERRMSSQYADLMDNHNAPWANNLTHGEIDAIGSYTGSGHHDLNAALRTASGLSSYQQTMNTRLNSAIEKSPKPPPPDLVWRGISNPDVIKLFADLKPGDTFPMKGFQSTSISPKFAHDWGHGKLLFEIKPSKGAYVRLKSSHKSEMEYLLPHGKKYTVRGISKVKLQGVSTPVRVLQIEMHD